MPGKLKIKATDSSFVDVGTVLSVGHDAEVDADFSRNRYVRVGTFIKQDDPPSLLEHLGLREDTPPEVIRELLQFLARANPDTSAVAAKVERIGLKRWFKSSMDNAERVLKLVALIPTALAALKGFGGV